MIDKTKDRTISGKQAMIISFCVALGIMLRFLVMTFGYNYDFESYCIVGEISRHLGNVYAETNRYNYGFVFYCIQALTYNLAYVLDKYFSFPGMGGVEEIFRVLMVSVLTLADLGIAGIVAKKYNLKLAIIFFLNPISIYISGYHNQFDNIAILFIMIAALFYNEEEKFNKNDILFVVFFSLSLLTKHIFFMVPLWILFRKNLSLKKKALYSFVAPAVFLMSFIPFALSSTAAFEGIMANVFKYRSSNNFPLLYMFFMKVHYINEWDWKYFFMFFLAVAGIFAAKMKFEDLLLFYMLALFTFSSAITDQYLIIPIVALLVFTRSARWIYLVYFMFCNYTLINPDAFKSGIMRAFIEWQSNYFVRFIPAVCLTLIVILKIIYEQSGKTNKLIEWI